MSKKESDRLEVLLGVQSGRLRVADACELLSLKRRGRPSNNRLAEAYRKLALSLMCEQ